jgi:anti-sigma regulatory factor (Ser/Thr protein kinase)
MELASRIQQSLLPAAHVVESDFVVAGWQRPASEVGGDFYDVFRLEDGKIGVAIADVAGKGLAGCLVTMMVAALLAALRDHCAGPADLLATIDERLSPKLARGTFVTMFVAFLDPRTGQVRFASAGHHAAVLIRRGGQVEHVHVPGRPIGTDRMRGVRGSLGEGSIELAPGDALLQTTDGIHESERGGSGEPFGFERVEARAIALAPGGAQSLLMGLPQAVDEWRGDGTPFDDETLIVLSREIRMSRVEEEPFREPLERLADAEKRGIRLKVPATFDALVRLDDWLERLPGYGPAATDRDRVRFVLHELCANVIEHGYAGAVGKLLEVWWVPGGSSADAASSPLREGYFLILDQGKPFSADNLEDPDLGDPAVRRRGRGYGLTMVRRATRRFAVHPGTPRGNVTLFTLAPAGGEGLRGEPA